MTEQESNTGQRESPSAFQGMECLPPELLSNVLSRLPAKDLMLCKRVCKSWFDITTNPYFISNYYVFYNSREVQQREHLLLITRPYNSVMDEISIVSWNPNEPKGFVSSRVLDRHYYHRWYSVHSIQGPSNGIYFVGVPNVIMNPSLGHYIALPESHFNAPVGTYFRCDYPCFGFDSKTNDYKVVMLKDLWIPEANKRLKGVWRVELYSLNSNSWRNLGDDAIPFPFVSLDCCTYVNNCCHWWGYVYESDEDDDVENVVLSFDMVNELFRKIKVPQITHPSGRCYIELAAFTESATIELIAYPASQGTQIGFCFDVWMMKDYWDDESWIKQYSIGPLPVIYKQLVGFCGGIRFLWKDANGKLALYDPHCEGQTRTLAISGKFKIISSARYMESLVSLKRGNQSSSQLIFM